MTQAVAALLIQMTVPIIGAVARSDRHNQIPPAGRRPDGTQLPLLQH